MIVVTLKKENDVVNEITIIGHAEYEDTGKDIVCASVSSIVLTTVNAIMRINRDAIDYIENDGVWIKILKSTVVTDKLIDNLIDLLLELEKQYSKYIEIRRC
ncbi:MAG: ribosomal-processing cysteine protease Prp [Bacilli bacterium]